MTDAGIPLTLAHAAQVEPALRRLREPLGADCLSDFTFSNLWLFRRVHDYRLHEGEWPCITGRTYDGARHVFPLFDLARAPRDVLQGMLAEAACFFPVSQAVVARLDPTLWHVASHDADADYLYPAAQFRDYPGRLLQKKRNLVRQFLRGGEVCVVPLGESHRPQAEAVLDQWLRDRDRAPDDADAPGCREALVHREALRLQGRICFKAGRPVGFVLVQDLGPGVAVVRFAKGVRDCPGVFPFLFQDLCLSRPDLQWVNFEQDLGNAGFRQSKRSYGPAGLLKKHRVMLR